MTDTDGSAAQRYDTGTTLIRATFQANLQQPGAGAQAIQSRAALVDSLVQSIWSEQLQPGIAVLATGGYGRAELFPYSDVDLMFLLDAKVSEKSAKEPIRCINQALWDAGLRVSAMTRTLAECEKFDLENVEFTLALFDARPLAGESALAERLLEKSVPRLIARDRKKITARLLDVTRTRHARFGDTLFHLEPNLKECPGGLRDAHVCAWLARLSETSAAPPQAFAEARQFLLLARTFLHYRHGRDDNTLDWQTQDEAAATFQPGTDAAYWMRLYFRHARAIERAVAQSIEEAAPPPSKSLLAAFRTAPHQPGFELRQNRITFTDEAAPRDPDIALALFATVARTQATLSREAEAALEGAIPLLSANLEDGPKLWKQLEAILTAPHAGQALRAMHALGVLELLLPEFHGIDALVIRDAYHRYTVDEHTFVLIDTLHTAAAPFATLLRDLPHPSLLYLAALLHDTGKGRATPSHAQESARMAEGVLSRLELDPYEGALVLDLIRNHLEMSAALRRDVFDTETIRAFAARVQTPEALRMLTLFTYADIRAVHPDALTPWKAENLWSLHIATANFLDRNVDDERVATHSDLIASIRARHPSLAPAIAVYLEGFPRRYLQTRTADQIRTHAEMAARLPKDPIQLDFRFAPTASELTLVTRDRPALIAQIAGALAAWGMNILTADAFSNAHGIVVDSFRFTDTFRTLELNESERTRFVSSVHDVIAGATSVESLLAARRRGRRTPPKIDVPTRVDIDPEASRHSTLVQVVAQDTPGLLRVLSLAVAQHQCNIEVALIDTEGEMAIDVFYLTHTGAKLDEAQAESLRQSLIEAVSQHAQ
jgi:[protein-PII] uridylyltransferase